MGVMKSDEPPMSEEMPEIDEDAKKAEPAAIEMMKSYISENLKALIEIRGTSQKQFATDLGIAPSALNEYIKGKSIPNLSVLYRICNTSSINQYGFTLHDFVNTSIDFTYLKLSSAVNQRLVMESTGYGNSNRVLGVYMVCFANSAHTVDSTNPLLKYGVLFIYRMENSMENASPFKAFLKVINSYAKAKEYFLSLKNSRSVFAEKLHEVESQEEKKKLRNLDWRAICEVNGISVAHDSIYPDDSDFCYIGDVCFSKAHKPHMFFTLVNVELGDCATFIFNTKDEGEYIGGLGILTSIRRGALSEHIPVAHKLIISKYLFDADSRGEYDEARREELFMDYLEFQNNNFQMNDDVSELAEYCIRLMDDQSPILQDMENKIALLRLRVTKIMTNCFAANARSMFGVTDNDNSAVERMLEEFREYSPAE